MLQRNEPADALIFETEALLLYETQLVRLAPIGMAIFENTARPIDATALTTALIAEFGEPEGGSAAQATSEAVARLVGLGVLREVTGAGPHD